MAAVHRWPQGERPRRTRPLHRAASWAELLQEPGNSPARRVRVPVFTEQTRWRLVTQKAAAPIRPAPGAGSAPGRTNRCSLSGRAVHPERPAAQPGQARLAASERTAVEPPAVRPDDDHFRIPWFGRRGVGAAVGTQAVGAGRRGWQCHVAGSRSYHRSPLAHCETRRGRADLPFTKLTSEPV